jgi:hypothetical protein
VFFGRRDKNFILANTAPKPIQAQMPLICKGLRFPLCSIFNHLVTFFSARLPLGKTRDKRRAAVPKARQHLGRKVCAVEELLRRGPTHR